MDLNTLMADLLHNSTLVNSRDTDQMSHLIGPLLLALKFKHS